MARSYRSTGPRHAWIAGGLCFLVSANSLQAQTDPPPTPPPLSGQQANDGPVSDGSEGVPESFTRAAAIDWALRNNPDLAAFRQQHGIAMAAVIIAKTYPFNPVWTNKLFAVNGPESAGITNRLAMEQRISIDVEVRHQRRYRRQAACAALSRTDWEILNQELLLAMRVIRAFDNALYQRDKLQLAEESLRLQQSAAEQVDKLVKGGILRGPDNAILARSEVDTFSIAVNTARSVQARAESDLRAALGLRNEAIHVAGALSPTPTVDDAQNLVQEALDRRPDLQARQAALHEAEGRLRLAIADRFGNPNIGPDYEYNETRANFLGMQMTVPLPVFNKHRGEILQREAERNRAALDLRSTETLIQQQVYAALSRLNTARATVEMYQTRVLPHLEESVKDMERLFLEGGGDLLRVINLRAKLLQARGGQLDALYELRQGYNDLAAAVADPTLTLDAAAGGPAP
ncbi:MAG TPA: TolC family protein [Gemmataceae bacterium]|nr:TolC family protein [Gemmataceae bacterium]